MTDQPEWGADAIFDIVDGKMVFRSYYKLPAPQTTQENCVAHNSSLMPVPGRDILVQAWYQGGMSVIDFTDSANPVEIAYYDRGPINTPNPTTLNLGGLWSTYWYNGYVFGSEIARGFDAFGLLASDLLSAERDRRRQPRSSWPSSTPSTRPRSSGSRASASSARTTTRPSATACSNKRSAGRIALHVTRAMELADRGGNPLGIVNRLERRTVATGRPESVRAADPTARAAPTPRRRRLPSDPSPRMATTPAVGRCRTTRPRSR